MNTYAYTIRRRNGWGTGCGPAPTHCAQCEQPLAATALGHAQGTGYACGDAEPVNKPDFPLPPLKRGEQVERSKALCYPCCGKNDEAAMIRDGRAVLYLVSRSPARVEWHVTNWPGTLDLETTERRYSKHGGGFGAQRTDVWFTGPDGKPWHGVNQGDNQVLRCRRVKS